MNREEQVKRSVLQLLEAIGEDTGREGLRDTPVRVARLYADVFSGVGKDPAQEITTVFTGEGSGHNDPVVLRDVPFFSICEHHLLPFFGVAQMGYVPNGKLAGASKLARALDTAARRPQMQERLTAQVAGAIFESLIPYGAGVIMEAEHLCMTMRGVRKPGSRIVTSAFRGSFRSRTSRDELRSLLQG